MDMLQAGNWEELAKLFSTHMSDYEKKLSKVAASSSTSVQPDVSSLCNEFTEFKSFVWQALTRLKSQMEFLHNSIDRLENAARRKVLLIHGLPEKENEKLPDTVHKVISKQLKLTDVSIDNLHVCHRLGPAKQKARPVLVRFRDIEDRQSVWENKSALKGTGITISEFLTANRHKIFTASRKHFGVKNSWTVESRIVVLLPDKTRRKIETMTELQALMSKYPSSNTHNTDPAPSVSTAPNPTDVTKRPRRR